MFNIIGPSQKRRNERILKELKRLTPHGNPKDVSELLSKVPSVLHTPGLQGLQRLKALRYHIAKINKRETRRQRNDNTSPDTAHGKRYTKVHRTRRRRHRRRGNRRRGTNRK